MTPYAPLSLTPEQIIAFTPEWTGERSEDGRPRVPDEIVKRMKSVSIAQAWGVLMEHGYRFQYEGGWERIHPEETLCGRALTAQFIPRRPDLNSVIEKGAAQAGCAGELTSWPIYCLERGDVYVADVFGKSDRGPVIGENLSTAIFARTGCGVLHNASVRDHEGIEEIAGFPVFARSLHPSFANPTISLGGINCPVRIGQVTVMPGGRHFGQTRRG